MAKQLLAIGITVGMTCARPAGADPFVCESTTKRPASEVVVGLGSTMLASPEQALNIKDGESLCLTGTVFDTGELYDMRLRRKGEQGGTSISIALAAQAGGSTLTVRHADARTLRCVLFDMPRRDITLRDQVAVAAPGAASEIRLTGRREQLALMDCRFDNEGPVPNVARRTRQPSRDLQHYRDPIAVYPLFGWRWLSLPDVDRVLGAQGYAPLQKTFPQYGFGLYASTQAFRLTMGWATGARTAEERAGSEGTSVRYSELDVLGGWQAIRAFPFLGDVSAGVTLGTLTMNRRLAGCTADPCDASTVEGTVFALTLEHGGQHTFWASQSGLALGFGYRLGYLRQLGGVSWDTSEGERDGPDLNVTGVRGRIWLGLVLR